MSALAALHRNVAPTATRRSVGTTVLVVLACVLVAGFTLMWGQLGVSPATLSEAAAGGELDVKTRFVLERLRGPRVLVAIGVGLALGISGALFQRVTRNPLGSPDVIGLAAGAGAGVAISTLLAPQIPASFGAVAGAGLAVVLVYFANGAGFSSPARIIITGIGVAAMCTAVTQFVVTVVMSDAGAELAAYTVGTLNSRTLGDAATIAAALLLLIPLVVALSYRLLVMDMGDPLADTLGGRAKATRSAAIILATLLSAVSVAVAGPISFVALAAPHIARRVTGSVGTNFTTAAVVGALIMLTADAIAQHLPIADGLPTGIVTIGVGGCYLGYLLLTYLRTDSR